MDCANPAGLAEFWSSVLGGTPVHRHETWCYLDPPGWTRLAFQQVPEPKQLKNRVHLDVVVDDVTAATETAVGLGATVVSAIHRDAAGEFQVLQDPEGNEWCVVHPAARDSLKVF